MVQKLTHKKTLIAVICATALAGCLDDPYKEPVKPSVTPPSDRVPLYSSDASDSFLMTITDSTGMQARVETSGSVKQGNISATHITNESKGIVNVDINDSAPGRVMLQSSDSSHISLDIDPAKATLQFDTRVIDKPTINHDIYLTTQKELDTDSGKVSLTSSFLASYGSAPQTVKVPLSCFTDAGMNFTQIISPFALESSSDLNFDLSNIRIETNSTEQSDVLTCDHSVPLLGADDVNDPFQASSMFTVDNWVTSGWATNITNWMTNGNSTLHWGHDHIRIEYSNAPKGENGGLVLQAPDLSGRDMSNYINDGVLQFMFYVANYAQHPTKRFQVQMESSKFGNSERFFLPAGTGEAGWLQVQVPLRTLFTRTDGSININALKNIDKPISILPEWIDSEHSLQGMEFSIGQIKIVVP